MGKIDKPICPAKASPIKSLVSMIWLSMGGIALIVCDKGV